jgi:tetratricopeptide (TPR) repeat protein
LLKGKKFLDHGDYTDAVTQFKTATTLLATNAAAWNYYGVALQRAGQPDDAANAYKQALNLNRDLVEAHLNLGSLWLEQNKPDAAKAEFTAYTLQRTSDPAGWIKLGSAQLKLGETVPAEKSFSTVLYLKPNDAEAYNGLGMARIQRGKPQEAAKFFSAAIQSSPNFAPAILNLATVSHQYLQDNKTALDNYHAYLALTPRPANWDEVNALASGLEQSLATAAPMPTTIAKANPPEPKPAPEPKQQTKVSNSVTSHPAVSPKPQTAARVIVSNPAPTRPAPAAPMQIVQVKPEPQIVTKPNPTAASTEPPEVQMPEPAPAQKSGFWHRLFGPSKKENPPNAKFMEQGVTPLPATGEPVVHATAPPADVTPAPVIFAHYHYLSPRKPSAGDRTSASGAFTKAQMFEQDEKWLDAVKWYQTTAQLDPSWFEEQDNTGVLAHRLRNYPLALPSYEMALAIQPDSADARYNFALALKAAAMSPTRRRSSKKFSRQIPARFARIWRWRIFTRSCCTTRRRRGRIT